MTGERDKSPAEAASYAFQTARLGIWGFLATEVLLFGGLFTAYTVFRMQYPEMFHSQHQHLNKLLGGINTVVLICSSLFVAIGTAAIKKGRVNVLRGCIMATLVLAAAFLCIKYVEYSEHITRGELPSSNLFFSLYYMMTGLHAVHVLGGMTALAAVYIAAGRGRYSEEYSTPVDIVGIYWHFVDLVWIYLFPMLYLIG